MWSYLGLHRESGCVIGNVDAEVMVVLNAVKKGRTLSSEHTCIMRMFNVGLGP